MSGMTTETQGEFQQHWQGALSDYITTIVWSPDGTTLAACSAIGEVVLLNVETLHITFLQAATQQSVDCLAFSHDAQFLAAGGQDGQVKIWRSPSTSPELVTTLDNKAVWTDSLQWSPVDHQLAFSFGRYVQVWDAQTSEVVTTLDFEVSSVFAMDWRSDGQYLALAGYQGARIWYARDWDAEVEALLFPTASVAVAWSTDNQFIATGNLDNTLTVTEWENPYPWVMRGFPGKVRHLAWSQALTSMGTPMLVSCSAESVIAWERHSDEEIGWANRELPGHEGVVRAIAFQPKTLLLASAAEDGWVALWENADQLFQTLDGAPSGFACLAWHPQGRQLAAGGQAGELIIWSESHPGKEVVKT
jgi:WD40 repeat protein